MRTSLLIAIILLAFFLRFWSLGNNPPSLTWDEVAFGYNAYSLGIDGRDEFGRFLPLDYLESFGDFKPPMYAYLDIIPVKLLGLTEFAVRFPSALFGVLTVLVTYLLVKRIFSESKSKELYALLSSLFLAISPWHIMLSRAAFEANVATFFLISGVWLFLKAVRDKSWYLTLSAVSFTLSLYTFNTARVVVPLLVLVLAIGFFRKLLEEKKQAIFAIVVGILLFLPMFKFMLSPQASLRFKEVNIFSDIEVIKTANQEILNDNNAWWSKILHNRRFAYSVEFFRHYFDNLNPVFLFIRGDGNPKFSTQDVGELYLWDLPFFIAGALFLFRKRVGHWWVVPFWLILGIVPAATSRETPHALRIEATLPTFQILTAIGAAIFIGFMSSVKGKIANIPIKHLIFGLLFLFLTLNFIYFLHGYYRHYAREYSGEWQYGYKESLGYLKTVENKFDQINFTTELGRPYIYYLFYGKIDPEDFRKNLKIQREVFGFANVLGVGKYKFAKEADSKEIENKKVLYVNTPSGVKNKAKILRTFYLLSGKPVLVAYE